MIAPESPGEVTQLPANLGAHSPAVSAKNSSRSPQKLYQKYHCSS